MLSERLATFLLRDLEAAQSSLIDAQSRLKLATEAVPRAKSELAKALHDCGEAGLQVTLNDASQQYERVDPGYSERTIEIGR